MNILIVEDETHAAHRLQKMIAELKPDYPTPAHTDGILSTLKWIKDFGQPDLIFLDIHLSDGISFHLFEVSDIKSSVIFTTAYDQYALRAFKVNSIDYLLKPIDKELLKKAIEKWEKQRFGNLPDEIDWNALKNKETQYKGRFLVKLGDRLVSIPSESIDYFVSEEKLTFIHSNGKKYVVDFTLDELEGLLNPNVFFRLNRKIISSINNIEQIHQHFNGKLKITLQPKLDEEEIYVSREKAHLFKAWLDR